MEQVLYTVPLSHSGDSGCAQIRSMSTAEGQSGATNAASVLATWGWSKGGPGSCCGDRCQSSPQASSHAYGGQKMGFQGSVLT